MLLSLCSLKDQPHKEIAGMLQGSAEPCTEAITPFRNGTWLALAETEDTVGPRVILPSLEPKGKQGLMSPLQNLSSWSLQAGSSQIINQPGKRELQLLTGCQWALSRDVRNRNCCKAMTKTILFYFLKIIFTQGEGQLLKGKIHNSILKGKMEDHYVCRGIQTKGLSR